MSDEAKPKMWLFRGETRTPRKGEWFITMHGEPLLAHGDIANVGYAILHPVADDCVMVPRQVVETLRPLAEDSFILAEGNSVGFEATGRVIKKGDKHALDELLACAKPVEEEDAILEALREVAELACSLTDTACDEEERCAAKAAWRSCDRAIALREAELKARKS